MPVMRNLRNIEDRVARVRAVADFFLDDRRAAEQIEMLQVGVCTEGGGDQPQLHDVLKARAMVHPVPLQYVRLTTYDKSKLRKQYRGQHRHVLPVPVPQLLGRRSPGRWKRTARAAPGRRSLRSGGDMTIL